MGDVLKYPLVRLKGRCTKVFPESTEAHFPRRSSSAAHRTESLRPGASLAQNLRNAMRRRAAHAHSDDELSQSNDEDGEEEEVPGTKAAAAAHPIQFSTRAWRSAATQFNRAFSPTRSPERSPRASPMRRDLKSGGGQHERALQPRARGRGSGVAVLKIASEIPDLEAAGSKDRSLEDLDAVAVNLARASVILNQSAPAAESSPPRTPLSAAKDELRRSPDVPETRVSISRRIAGKALPAQLSAASPSPSGERRTIPHSPPPGAEKQNQPPRRHLGVLSHSGDHRHDALAGDEEDGTAERALRDRANVAFYWRMSALLCLLIPDIVTLVVFQMAWGGPVFLCKSQPTQDALLDGWKTEVDRTNVAVLSALLGLHVLFLASEVRTRGTKFGSALVRFVSKEWQGGWLKAGWNLMYLLVVLASFVVLAVDVRECTTDLKQDFRRAARMHRVHMLVHLLRCVCVMMLWYRLSGTLRTRLQSVVSMNKRRFIDKEQHFDLDLSYICDRLLAMSLPCVRDALYRNDVQQVARFFASRHYGHFVVLNLCNGFEEGGNGNYDQALLYNQVQRLPMHDHHAPFMQTLVAFLEAAVEFLNTSHTNVVAVHCRGGKGRTGTFCSALMLWVGCCQSAEEAMRVFAKRRTCSASHSHNLQGVDAPCQKRCLKYLEAMIFRGVDTLAHSPLLLSRIRLMLFAQGSLNLSVIVEERGAIVYDSGKAFGALQPTERQGSCEGGFDLEFCFDPILLQGDVTVRLFLLSDDPRNLRGTQGSVSRGGARLEYAGNNGVTVKGRQIAFVSIHTAFHSGDVSLEKHEVDGAYQDRENRLFLPGFAVDLALFRGSYQQALETLRERDVVDASVLANYEVTGRLPPAIDALRTEQQLERLMQRLCPVEEELWCGQTVFDSRSSSVGDLCFVVSGQVSYSAVRQRGLRAYGKLGISTCPVMGTVGAGSLLGMQEMVMGPGSSPFGTIYVAKTELVRVRRYKLPSNAHGPAIPSTKPEVSATDLEIIFKKLAQSLSAWSVSLAQQLGALTEMSNCVKREYTSAMEMEEKQALVRKVEKRYMIPLTERVLVLSDAVLEGRATADNQTADRTPGQILLFPRFLIFVPSSSLAVGKDLMMPVKSIARTQLSNNQLIVTRDGRRSICAKSEASGPPSPSWSPIGTRRKMMRSLSTEDRQADPPGSAIGKPSALVSAAGTMARPSFAKMNLVPSFILKERRRSSECEMHNEVGGDHRFVLTDGMEAALRVQEAIEKQRTQHASEIPPPILIGTPNEFQDLLQYFAFHFPDEELSTEEARALAQLTSPLRRKMFKAGSEICAEGDVQQVILLMLSGTVVARARGGAVIATLRAGELLGERSFWGHGNRGKTTALEAETDAQVLLLDYESVEIVSSGRPIVAARFARCLTMSIARRIERQLNLLLQVEQDIISSQELL